MRSTVTVAEAGKDGEANAGKEGRTAANNHDLSGTSGANGGAADAGTSRWLSASSPPPPEGSRYREVSPRRLHPDEKVSGQQRRRSSGGVAHATAGHYAQHRSLSPSSFPAEHGMDRLSRERTRLGMGRAVAAHPAVPRARLGARRASAPPERRLGHMARTEQRETGSSAAARSIFGPERMASATASLTAAAAAAEGAAEGAEAASYGDLSRQQRPNCIVPSTGGAVDVWGEPAGGDVLSRRTQGDLLRQQRARGGVASYPSRR